MSEELIRAVQLKQLSLIKKVHKICVDNGIKYTLLGGSLLGAVRHKGFIPWDDDLDIGLPREDYEKLLAYIKANPIEGCFLQTYETDPHYTQPFAKLRLDNTKYLESYWKNVDMHQGIFIDIFPLDRIAAPGSRTTEFRRLIAKEITFSIWRKEHCIIERKGFKKLEQLLSSIIGIFPKTLLVKIQKKFVVRNNKDWKYWGSMFSSNYSTKKVYFTEDDMKSLTLLPYEDTELFGPATYDVILTRMFKNYMKLPPVDKRDSGHDVYLIDLGEEA